MERKKALLSASTATFVLGSVIVTAAALGHVPLLGFGTHSVAHAATAVAPTTAPPSTKPRVVVRTKDVYDPLVVDTGNTDQATTESPTPTTNAAAPTPDLPPTTVAPGATPAPKPRHESDDEPRTSETTPTTTAAPASPTTTLPTTPTTQRVQIPDDWPAGKPIPPVPPNCFQPELRLNGTWNCQNDD